MEVTGVQIISYSAPIAGRPRWPTASQEGKRLGGRAYSGGPGGRHECASALPALSKTPNTQAPWPRQIGGRPASIGISSGLVCRRRPPVGRARDAMTDEEAHRRPHNRFANRFRIGGVMLIALDVCLHVLRRHQSHLVPSLPFGGVLSLRSEARGGPRQ
jgi:hypothetical protein